MLLLSFLVYNLFIYFLCYEFIIFGTLLLVLILGFSIYSISAGFYLFLFTCLGTIFFLGACLYSFLDINFCYLVPFNATSSNSNFRISYSLLIGILLFIVFAIKIPCWPFHYWLLLVHSESSTSLSLFLAALLLKFGFYGFFLYCFIYSLSILCPIIISNSIFAVFIVIAYFLAINDLFIIYSS
jgi:NADH-quinone oxidoreductase subunit M